jgi:long-chain acyl-CoA synthetase
MIRREAEATDEHPILADTTLSVAFEESADRHVDALAQLYKGGVTERSLVAADVLGPAPDGEFRGLTYGRVREIVRNLAAGFRDLGVGPDDRVGLFAHTRMEWAQCDFGLLAAGAVVTTVYPSSSADQVQHLLADSGARGVVVENADLLDRVLGVVERTDCEFAVVIDDLDPADLERDPETAPIEIHTLASVHDRGAAAFDPERYRDWLDARERSDLASLIYTSGTTGRPKGVRLTHGNFRANVRQCFDRFGPAPDRPARLTLDAGDRALSFLPLSHVFERLAGHFLLLLTGVTVAYAESPDTLQEDFPRVRPTVGTSVPRVYEKLHAAVRESAAESRAKRRLFDWATGIAAAWAETDDPGPALRLRHAIADRLVFRRVRAALGGEIDFLISGGGSLSPALCGRYHAMGIPVITGYGLTEAAPVIAANSPDAPEIGTVGPPLQGVETRLDPERGERLEPVDGGTVGELLVRGPNVTDGYWNDPDATAAAFTDDGWLRTGDVVERRPDGYLRFRERVGALLTLSTGKTVAPVPVEDALTDTPLIAQALVVGDARRFAAALVVPDTSAVRSWGTTAGVDLPARAAELCADDRVRDRIAAEVAAVNERLEPHERVKRFRLVPESFTETNGLLTPTLKKRRRAILERYRAVVDSMYGSG